MNIRVITSSLACCLFCRNVSNKCRFHLSRRACSDLLVFNGNFVFVRLAFESLSSLELHIYSRFAVGTTMETNVVKDGSHRSRSQKAHEKRKRRRLRENKRLAECILQVNLQESEERRLEKEA